MAGRIVRNTVKGARRGSKYPEERKTAALLELMASGNLHQVAQKYRIPESTLRGWVKREREAPPGQETPWRAARREQMRRLAAKAAQGAELSLDLMQRRLDAGQRQMQRVEQIDALLWGEALASGVVTGPDGVVTGELRGRPKLDGGLAKDLLLERQQRKGMIPQDKSLADFARTLVAVAQRGDPAAAQQPGTRPDGEGKGALEQLLAEMAGEEF